MTITGESASIPSRDSIAFAPAEFTSASVKTPFLATTGASTTALADGSAKKQETHKKGTRSGSGAIDTSILKNAIAAIENLDPDDPLSVGISLSSLLGLVEELWHSAGRASPFHQQILAGVETALISAEKAQAINARQCSVIRSGLLDLTQPLLTATNVESIGSLLIDEGFSPLAGLSEFQMEDHA